MACYVITKNIILLFFSQHISMLYVKNDLPPTDAVGGVHFYNNDKELPILSSGRKVRYTVPEEAAILLRNATTQKCTKTPLRVRKKLVQSLNSSFFPPHIGAEPWRAKEESRITCMRMLRTNQSKITRSQPRCSRQCVAICWDRSSE